MASIQQATNAAETPALRAKPVLPPAFAALLGLSVIVPNLNYFREPPLVDFYGEWASLMLFCLAALFGLRLIPTRLRLNWSLIAIPLGLLSLIVLQFARGTYAYPTDWGLWTGYLFLFFFAILVGQSATAGDVRRELVDRLFWAFIVTALVNFFLQLLQVTKQDGLLGPFIMQGSCRPFGNLAQANHASTMAWSAIAGLVYFAGIGRVKPLMAGIGIAALLFSSALTASRMPWIYLVVLCSLIMTTPSWPLRTARARWLTVGGLASGFAVASLLALPLFANFGAECTSALVRFSGERGTDYAIRIDLWREALLAWTAAPLLGSGVNGFMGQAYQLVQPGAHMPLDYFAHNMALAFLVEFGAIGAGFVAVIVVWWLSRLVANRRQLEPAEVALIAWLGVIGVHAMLEYPLHYVQWVIPFGIGLGLLIRPQWSKLSPVVPARALVVAMTFALMSGAVWLLTDYQRLGRLLHLVDMQLSFETDDSFKRTIKDAYADVKMYRFYADHITSIVADPDVEDPQKTLALFERLIKKGPTPESIYRGVIINTYIGDLPRARFHLERLFMFFPNRQQQFADSFRKSIAKRPDKLAALAAILEEELARAPKARW